MNKEIACKQANLLLKLINDISSIQVELSNSCESECKGKTTTDMNEYYKTNYQETYNTLDKIVDIVAQRYYELNQI